MDKFTQDCCGNGETFHCSAVLLHFLQQTGIRRQLLSIPIPMTSKAPSTSFDTRELWSDKYSLEVIDICTRGDGMGMGSIFLRGRVEGGMNFSGDGL